jgi:Leucine-rich repeat (LRR) protein
MEDSKTSLVVASSNEHTCWETCVDDEGNTYYFDPISGESTWDRPEQQDKNGRWIECRDDQDRTYYYDTQTQETTWNIPLEHRPYAKSVDLESKRRNRKVTGLIESDSSEKDIWMSKEELRAKSNDYILTTSDRLDLEKQQRAKKRKDIRAQIKEERKEINRKIFKTWEPHIKEALVTGALNCSWKGFRVVHPKVYEMKQLTALRLVGNALNDVPRKIGICLPNLRVLSLSCNGMRLLPSSIGRLVNLVELNLQKNCLATLPDEICNLVNLVDLDLTNNRLKELPKNFGNLRKIPRLSLERNRLTTLPDSFQDTKPSTLILTANSFCQFPSSVFNLVCLRRVSINQNSLETLPDAISKMVNLEYLSACNNLLTDLPHGITTLQNLKSLWLDWNSIEELPEGFRFLETLSDLKMEGNPMRFPMIEIIQRGGATAALKWCQNRHKRNVRMSKRAVVEALQKTFQLIRQHNIADASLFEPETEYVVSLSLSLSLSLDIEAHFIVTHTHTHKHTGTTTALVSWRSTTHFKSRHCTCNGFPQSMR